jgi:carbohydrate-selective porin OprB
MPVLCLVAAFGTPEIACAQPLAVVPSVPALDGTRPTYLNQGAGAHDNAPPNFVGPLAGIAKTLDEYGVDLNISFRDTFANAGTQGLTHWATANLGKLRLEASYDLSKLGLDGGSILSAYTIHMFKRNPYEYLALVGDSPANAVIGNHKPADALSILAYEQKLDADRVELVLGRYNPSYDFDPAICGIGPVCASNIAKFTGVFLPVDYGQLGAVVRFKFPDGFFSKFGVFEDVPPSSDKNGINFLLADSTGVLSLGQIGYSHNFKTSYYPGSYTFTGFQNSSKQSNRVTGQSRWGTDGFMLTALQTVWRSDYGPMPSYPAHHLDLYMKAGATPDDWQPYSTEVDAGANFYGLLPNRPFDAVGVKLSYFRVGANELAREEMTRVKAGGASGQTLPNEFRFELMGSVDIYRGMKLMPDIMYVLNADDHNGVTAKFPTDGFAFSLTLEIPLGSMLGLAPNGAGGGA